MPTLSSLSLPPPRDDKVFEDLCCELWRRIWADPLAQKNGRNGQPQAGVDVFGRPGGGEQWEGVQCKAKGLTATLTRKEIQEEVDKARTFKPSLSRFLIATTAPRDVKAQEAARLITKAQAQRKRGAFPVSIVSWDDILLELEKFPDLVTELYRGVFGIGSASTGGGAGVEAIEPRAAEIFVGREAEIAEIEAALLQGTAARPVAICSGMPGVGKSYLADRFAYLHRDRFPGGTFRVSLDPVGNAPPTAESLLSALSDRLQLPAAPEAALAGRVRERLCNPRSLLHVENVDSASLATVAGRLIARLSGCPVLVSGRFQGLGQSERWPQVRVQPFDEPTALDQLAQELASGQDAAREPEEAYRRLVRALGFLPLAVHLAAGHLLAGRTVDGFLASLRATRYALPPADPLGLSSDATRALVGSTFILSLDLLRAQLGADGERLIASFSALGHAPASGIGTSLGATLCDLPELDFENLAVTARRLSLLEGIPSTERQDRAYRMHPLLAELMRARSGPGGEAETLARMTEWFCTRLPQLPYGHEVEQGERWREVQAETAALMAWLPRVPASDRVRILDAGSYFAILNGPFHTWLTFCEELMVQFLEDAERSDTLWTLGQVARKAGDLERAAGAARAKLEFDSARGAQRDAALAAGLLADVLQARGEQEEALRIRREEELPVYERLGDARECAVTMGKIADVLQARGELEEALRIRREDELPVYERLGDVRERAVTMGKVADVLQARGELKEALRIRRQEELPVYERLGYVRARAVTMGKIADVLQARGELEEALRIRREEELPVYERLGDVRERALTMGKIADVLQARGELEEALRIRREDQLPVNERLGDVRERAVTMGKIADVLQARGELEEALRIRREEELPVYERLGDVRERAVTLGKIADVLQARGELEEALRIRREDQLPVYERLGDARALLVTRAKLALIYLRRNRDGDRETAAELLHLSLQAVTAMRLPEADRIRAILRDARLPEEPE